MLKLTGFKAFLQNDDLYSLKVDAGCISTTTKSSYTIRLSLKRLLFFAGKYRTIANHGASFTFRKWHDWLVRCLHLLLPGCEVEQSTIVEQYVYSSIVIAF